MRLTGALMLLALAVACLMAVTESRPQGYGKGEEGRVKIQTYRGPNEKKKGYEEPFARWGYYAQQPKDDKAKYHR